jgi:ribosomal protein S18 acetylase RimI-like enzyme
MAPAFSIRPAGTSDILAIASLFRDYAASLGIDLAYQGFETELASLPGAYAPPAGALLLAISPQSQPLGCVAMRKLTEDGACEMKRLYTTPSARGVGLGRALAMAAIGAAVEAGYQTMRLDTLPGMQAAQALYRDLGFEVTPPYYATPIAGTLFMRKTLPRP